MGRGISSDIAPTSGMFFLRNRWHKLLKLSFRKKVWQRNQKLNTAAIILEKLVDKQVDNLIWDDGFGFDYFY